MGYKTELQSNNADLQTILNKVNALPEAGGGGGGSVETCTVIIRFDGPPMPNKISYIDGTQTFKTVSFMDNATYSDVMKNSIICLGQTPMSWSFSGANSQIINSVAGDRQGYFVDGNATFTFG